MNKLLKKFARKFLCPLNIHIKKNIYTDENIIEWLYCELCGKYLDNNFKWRDNPY